LPRSSKLKDVHVFVGDGEEVGMALDDTDVVPVTALAASIARHGGVLPRTVVWSDELDGPRKWTITLEERGIRYCYFVGAGLKTARDIAGMLGVAWSGQLLGTVVSQFYYEVQRVVDALVGRLSPDVYAALTQNNVKDGCVRGKVHALDDAFVASIWASLSTTFDVKCAYPSLMYNPLDDFCLPNANDEFVAWTEADDSAAGRDYADLPKASLFVVEVHRDPECYFQKDRGVFDRRRLQYAVGRGWKAHFTITAVLVPSNSVGASHFRAVLGHMCDLVRAACPEHGRRKEIEKHLGRVLSGAVLGVDRIRSTKCHFSSDADELQRYKMEEIAKGRTVRTSSKELRVGDEDFSFVLSRADLPRLDTNIAMYVQLTSWMTVKLFETQDALRATFPEVMDQVLHVNVDSTTFLGALDPKHFKDAFVQPGLPRPASALRKWGNVSIKEASRRGCTLGRSGAQRSCPPFAPVGFQLVPGIDDSSQVDAICKVAEDNVGLCIEGGPGNGKTHVLQRLIQAWRDEGRRVVVAAFTHVAKNKFGSGEHVMTVTRLAGRSSRLSAGDDDDLAFRCNVNAAARKFDVIVVDEATMVPIDAWHQLYQIKLLRPDMLFVIAGDPKQLPPPCEPRHHMESSHVRVLCHGLKVRLEVMHRFDAPLRAFADRVFELLSQSQSLRSHSHRNPAVLQLAAAHGVPFSTTLPDLVITKSNAFRKAINELKMAQHRTNSTHPVCLHLASDTAADVDHMQALEFGQDMWVYPGLPVMAIVTSSSGGVYNGENGTVGWVSDDHVCVDLVRFGEALTVQMTHLEFRRSMVPAYAITVHKSQGSTIPGRFAVAQLEFMSANAAYTCVTRATSLGHLVIVDEATSAVIHEASKKYGDPPAALVKMIKGRLRQYKAQDANAHHEVDAGDYHDVASVLGLFEACDGVCDMCGEAMNMTAVPPRAGTRERLRMWTLDRIDATRGHARSNCTMRCLSCNVGNGASCAWG
jgi:hypothetical protein